MKYITQMSKTRFGISRPDMFFRPPEELTKLQGEIEKWIKNIDCFWDERQWDHKILCFDRNEDAVLFKLTWM